MTKEYKTLQEFAKAMNINILYTCNVNEEIRYALCYDKEEKVSAIYKYKHNKNGYSLVPSEPLFEKPFINIIQEFHKICHTLDLKSR